MIKVAFVMEGWLPSPAVWGGAAEEWLDRLLRENERQERFTATVINVWDERAQREAARYPKTRFVMIQRGMRLMPTWKRAAAWMENVGLRVDVNRRYVQRVETALRAQDWDAVVVLGNETLVGAAARAASAPVVWWRYGNADAAPSAARQVWRYGADPGEGAGEELGLVPSVDLERFHAESYAQEREKLRARWGLSREDIVFASIGGDSQGMRWVLEAFEKLDMPYARLLLVGLDDRNAVVREWLRVPRETAKRVAFTGALSPESLPLCHAAADVVVLPSADRQTLWEAMASGRSIVCPAPAPEGVCGVPYGDAEALTETLRELHGAAQRREEMGAAARCQAEARRPDLAFRQVADALERLYGTGALVAPAPVTLHRRGG